MDCYQSGKIWGNKVESGMEHVKKSQQNQEPEHFDGIHELLHSFFMSSDRSDVFLARMFAELHLL